MSAYITLVYCESVFMNIGVINVLTNLYLLCGVCDLRALVLETRYRTTVVDYFTTHPKHRSWLTSQLSLDTLDDRPHGIAARYREHGYVFVLDNTPHSEVIFWHEVGHLLLQHSSANGRKLCQEQAADDYAAKQCGYQKVIAAIQYFGELRKRHSIDDTEYNLRLICLQQRYHDTSYH